MLSYRAPFSEQHVASSRRSDSALARRLALLIALAAVVSTAPAQTPAKPAAEENTVTLPEFRISENPANPYQSQQALSTSRVAMAIQDIPQTISVIPKELIEDTLGARMIDVAKYVTPIVESTLPFGGDRYQIRGFQVSQEFVDGTNLSGADGYSMSMAPYNIERIEVIKGPNAILVPGGSPGGVMNPITKSPMMKDKTTVTLELAEYMGNALSVDSNRVLSVEKGMATRVVAAYYRNDLYIKNQYRNGYMVAPSFSMNLGDAHKLTVKAEVIQNRETNLGGVPIDPTVGSDGYARIARGLPRNWSFGDETDSRHRTMEKLSGELLSTLGDHVSSRLYVMGDHIIRSDVGGTSAALINAGGGSRNPYTGKYEPGVNWNTSAWQSDTTGTVALTGTAVPVTDPSTWVYNRNNGRVYLEYTEAHIKNDYAIKFATDLFKSTTITGFAANHSKVHFKSYPAAGRSQVAANNLGAITYGAYAFQQPTPANGGTDKTAKQNDLQLFVYQNFSLLNDRLQLSGGVSRFFGELSRVDTTGTALDPALGTTTPSYNLSDTAKSLGVSIKVIKPLSVFYGYNSTGGTMPGSLSAGNNRASLKVAEGDQNEYGVKANFLDGRLTATFSYFDIVQENYPVPNSEYYVLIAQGITPPADFPNPLYLALNSKGWEFEMSYSLNKNLTFLGNYTDFKVRQPITDVRLRAVPDQAGGFYVDYRFTEGVIKGFGVNLGVDYKSDVVGENVTGYTTTKPLPTGAKFVPSQPTFKVAGRTVANLGFSYRRANWTARLTVANVLDKDYILAAGSRGSLVVADPRNVKGSFSYSF